jgi:uncharacterized alpha-E superfamily protein
MMLSKVADSMYWMSRYLERTEHAARLIDVHLNLMLDMISDLAIKQSRERLQLCVHAKPEEEEAEATMLRLTFDPSDSASIMYKLTLARENARQIREQISSEMWMQINKLYLEVKQVDKNNVWYRQRHRFYSSVKEGSHLFQGITDATMNHNQAWHFIQVGRYLERLLNLVTFLEVHKEMLAHAQVNRDSYFELLALLKSVSAFEAYCKVYGPDIQSRCVTEFLLFDAEFPRSARFCVEMILMSLNAIAEATLLHKNNRLHRLAGRLQSTLSFGEIEEVLTGGLHNYLRDIRGQAAQIHEALFDTYITYPIETALR